MSSGSSRAAREKEEAAAAALAESKRRALKDGEWACIDAKCAHVNQEHRNTCENCGKSKPRAKSRVGREIGKDAAEKSKGLFSAEDWVCTKCGNVNWARRNTCNVCNAKKLGDLERRTGYGGGYMDRQDVEYIKREDDSEFDEFGRRKKKAGDKDRKDEHSRSLSPTRSTDGQLEDGEDEQDSETDLGKYELGEDSEEEDDGDDDIGKYDLTADPEIADKKIEIMILKKTDYESDCTCSCSGGECSCSESEGELERKREEERKLEREKRERERELERTKDRDKRGKKRSRSRDREKDRKKSRSRDRKTSRDKDHRSRNSRDRDRERDRKRSRSRDRRHSRSRDRDYKKDRYRR